MVSPSDINRLDLVIGGLGVQLRTGQPEVAELARQRYRCFSQPGLAMRFHCDIEWAPLNDIAASHIPVIYTPAGLEFSSPVGSGKIDLPAGEAFFHCSTTQIEGALEYFLRLVYAYLVFEAGGLMVHGAGILRFGRVAVFFGHSGSGKTTVARLSGEEDVLNDDLLLLLPGASGWQVSATPFWNPSQVRPKARQAPLGGLFRLVQDRRVYLEPASPAVALAELTSAVPVLNADLQRIPIILDRLAHLHADHPVQFLHFLPDSSFWEAVEPFLLSCGK